MDKIGKRKTLFNCDHETEKSGQMPRCNCLTGQTLLSSRVSTTDKIRWMIRQPSQTKPSVHNSKEKRLGDAIMKHRHYLLHQGWIFRIKISYVQMWWPWKGPMVVMVIEYLMPWQPSRTSWAGGQPGCWGGHPLGNGDSIKKIAQLQHYKK